jgi:16S rRNA C967 or C1407 C5-methylase (RsmB/RsmF family)/NOL1/NOP2/fmu family ribosome biogenesis protein
MAMNLLPEAFKQNILSLFPEEAGYFFDALSLPPVTSIRLNKDKASNAFAEEEKISWCQEGRYLKERPSFTEDPMFFAGAYYVQESSSQFLSEVIKHLKFNIDSPVALDLCASPGGKSTLLLDNLPSNSLLVSNEIIKSRVLNLQENIIKWGKPNVVITQNDPKHFQKLENFFDLIVVDAPCSGEGLWRRDANAIEEWSEENVGICVARQERILEDVLPSLKPGGFLIYSTCTFNIQENENQINRLLVQTDLKPYPIQVDETWPIKNADGFLFRFLPHLTKGEGLFMAVLQKPFEQENSKQNPKKTNLDFVPKKQLPEIKPWLNQAELFDFFVENEFVHSFPINHISHYERIRGSLYVKHAGICMGKLDKAGKLIPTHSLALSIYVADAVPRLELNLEEAQTYLKKGNLVLNSQTAQGWCLACYKGLPLGWMKVLQNRVNNYYPTEYRILKDI